jgi:hypothetical protein
VSVRGVLDSFESLGFDQRGGAACDRDADCQGKASKRHTLERADSGRFKWTAKADSILEKNARAREALVQLAAGTN